MSSHGMVKRQWRHNEHDGVSNHRRIDCLFKCMFRRRSMKTSKLRVTGLCGGNPTGTGGFPSQKTSNAENVSISWRHHGKAVSDSPCRALLIYADGVTSLYWQIPWRHRRKVNSNHRAHSTMIILSHKSYSTGIILCMRPANERRRYIVTSSLIGWAPTYNDPWYWHKYHATVIT